MEVVLLTGGAGFIGSHVADAYLAKGHKVVVVDNLSSGKLENLENAFKSPLFVFEKCDITDKVKLEEVFKKYRPTVINHHAAQKSVPYSVEDPINNAIVNEIGLLNLIVLAGKYKIKRFIYVSSGGAMAKDLLYGGANENDIVQLESPYAITKYCGELYLKIYSKIYGFDWIGLRYANVYGPRQIPDGECGVVPIFMSNILSGKKSTVFVYDDMPKGCIRDYVNVFDVCEFNEIILETPVGLNTVYNIGSGNELTTLEVYEYLEEVLNIKLDFEIKGPRLGDIKRSVLDITKAFEVFGWRPKIDFKNGIKRILNK